MVRLPARLGAKSQREQVADLPFCIGDPASRILIVSVLKKMI